MAVVSVTLSQGDRRPEARSQTESWRYYALKYSALEQQKHPLADLYLLDVV